MLAATGTGREAIGEKLEGLSANGWIPLEGAIDTAGAEFEFSEVEGEPVVYVVSDGEETCGVDPVCADRPERHDELNSLRSDRRSSSCSHPRNDPHRVRRVGSSDV